MGKSALLEAVAGLLPGGLGLLRARCHPSESAYEYGMVRQLFDPVLGGRGEPTTLDEAAGAERRPTHDVLLGLLRTARSLASDRPLALLIDDLPHADPPSLRWFSYLARRLDHLPVLMAATTTSEPVAGSGPAHLADPGRLPYLWRVRPGPICPTSRVNWWNGPSTRPRTGNSSPCAICCPGQSRGTARGGCPAAERRSLPRRAGSRTGARDRRRRDRGDRAGLARRGRPRGGRTPGPARRAGRGRRHRRVRGGLPSGRGTNRPVKGVAAACRTPRPRAACALPSSRAGSRRARPCPRAGPAGSARTGGRVLPRLGAPATDAAEHMLQAGCDWGLDVLRDAGAQAADAGDYEAAARYLRRARALADGLTVWPVPGGAQAGANPAREWTGVTVCRAPGRGPRIRCTS